MFAQVVSEYDQQIQIVDSRHQVVKYLVTNIRFYTLTKQGVDGNNFNKSKNPAIKM